MPRIVKVIYSDGLKVGYELSNGRRLSIKDTLKSIKNKEISNAYATMQGVHLKKGRQSDLPIVDLSKITPNVDVLTGADLQNFTNKVLANYPKERDFVEDIVNYCKSKSNLVYSVSGLRATGKSTGMLQAIKRLNCFNSSLYIGLNRGISYEYEYIKGIIQSNPSIKYVFIDEVTSIQNFSSKCGNLYDFFTQRGIKVVINGTDSYALTLAEVDGAFHRFYIRNVTYSSYGEMRRILNFSLKDYIEMGGLYRADLLNDVKGLRDYVDSSVVSNIVNSLSKNNKYLANYKDITSAVYIILYSIVYKNVRNEVISFTRILNIFNENNDTLLDAIAADLDLSLSIIDISLVSNVLRILQDIGIVRKVSNFANPLDYNFYITSPLLCNQVFYSLIRCLKSRGYSMNHSNFSQFSGLVLESMIICNHIDAKKYKVYFYRDKQSREIDLVIAHLSSLDDDRYVSCYEVKLTTDTDKAFNKSKWLTSEDIYTFIGENCHILERAILYTGENCKKNGVAIINAGYFLLNEEAILKQIT